MISSPVNAIVYYNDIITTTKHGSTFVSGSPKIIQLDDKMSLDALKQAIGNKISLPNETLLLYVRESNASNPNLRFTTSSSSIHIKEFNASNPNPKPNPSEDQFYPYLSIPTIEPTSSNQSNEPEFTLEFDLPNEELVPFHEDEDKVLYNQP
ncbi:hypothetical protein HKD37_17G048696 [Glycine soja]